MKKFFQIFIIFFTFALSNIACAFDETSVDNLMNLDFNKIDNPFAGQKIISDKEYDNAIARYKQTEQKRREGFWAWVFRHTLPKEMQVENKTPKGEELNPNALPAEFKAYKELLETKPLLILGTSIYDYSGKIVPSGHYQVNYKDGMINLYQGATLEGCIRAREIKDNSDNNDIIYAKIIGANEDYLKIIFSSSESAYEGYARIKRREVPKF